MMSRFIRGLFGLAVVGLVIPGFGLAPAQERGNRDIIHQRNSAAVLQAFRNVVAKPSLSTVRVLCDGKEVALGTVVGPDGWVLTKASELKGPAGCQLHDGRQLEARVVGVHTPSDLALLKMEAVGLTPVEWHEGKAAVGSWVAAPGIGELPVAVGVVGVAARPVTARDLPGPNVIPSGYLGIELAEAATIGAKISRVSPESPAARAGLKVDDLIVALAGQAVQDAESLLNALQRSKPGDLVAIRVLRGSEDLELKATLDRRPGGGRGGRGGDLQNRMGSVLSERRNGFPKILQHDAVLRPNDCGGPLVDLDGKVIGINVARAGRTESYAAPTEAVLPLLYDLMSGKLAPKPTAEGAAKTLSPEEKIARARTALQRAEAEKAAAEKKLAEAKAALEQAEAEAKGIEKTEPN